MGLAAAALAGADGASRDRQARAFFEVGRRVRRMHAVTRVALDVEFVERAAFQTSGLGGNSMNRPNAAALAVSSLCRRFLDRLRCDSGGLRRTPAPRLAREGLQAVPVPHRLAGGAHVSRRLPRPGNGDTSSRSGSTSRSWSPREPTPPQPPWAAGSYPVATASGAATVTAVSRGASLVSTAVLYQRLPTVIYGLADQGVDAPADLAGKRVGIHPDSTTRHEFAALLGIAGVRGRGRGDGADRWT